MDQRFINFLKTTRLPFYKTYKPSAALSEVIREFQVYHIDWNNEKDLPEPFMTCLANTEQNLYFILHDAMKVVPAINQEIPLPPVLVTGPKNKPVGLIFGKDHLMIKVSFQPTGTYRLCGTIMKKIVNTGIDATEIWGEEISVILKQLRLASSYDDMIEIVSLFLEKKSSDSCRPKEPLDDIAIQMLDPLSHNSMKTWANMACLSVRQFQRNFMTRIGISPKLYLRIVHFEYAMRIKNISSDKSWTDIASESGYTDSSHLLKEFKKFAEFPPSNFYLQPTSGYSKFPTG